MNNIKAAGQCANAQGKGKNMAHHNKTAADQGIDFKDSGHGANTPGKDYHKKFADQGIYKKKAAAKTQGKKKLLIKA